MGRAMRNDDFALLIVEDELLLVLSLELTVGDAGYRVVGSVGTLEEALEIAQRDRPDLALVDLRLARGESGFDVARALQSLQVPSLFMTGNRPAEAMPDLAIGCVSKPFSDEGLLAAIDLARCYIMGEPSDCEIPTELQLYRTLPLRPA